MHDLAFDLEFSELEQLADDTIQVNLISEKTSSVTSSHMLFFYVLTLHIGYISAADQLFVLYIQKA